MLCFFFLCLVGFNYFFTSPVDIENARLRLALAIPTGFPITVANDAIEMLQLVADKTIKDLSQKAIYLLNFLLINSHSLVSAMK